MKIKSNYIYLIVILLLVFLIGYLTQCKGKEPKQTVPIEKPDTIRPKITKNKDDRKIIADSAKIYREMFIAASNRKNYYKHLYKSVYDSLYSASDSACKSYLGLVQRVKEKQDSAHEAENEANTLFIVNAYNQIGELEDNEIQYELKIKQDSTDKATAKIEAEKKAKAEFKRGKKVGRVQGVIGTLFAELLLFLGFIAL